MFGLLRSPIVFASLSAALSTVSFRLVRGLHSPSSAKIMMESKLDSLLEEVSKLPLPNQRAIASVVGSCLADAAARPFHWCYDQKVIDDALQHHEAPFYPTSVSPYYTLPTGENSCYYDMGYVMLQSLPTSPTAKLDISAYKSRLDTFFGPESEYNQAFLRRSSMYDPAKRYEKREPVDGPWQQSSVTIYLEQRKRELAGDVAEYGNVKSRETDGLVSTLPLMARMFVNGYKLSEVESQIEIKNAAGVMSTNPFALTHTISAGLILEGIFHGESYSDSPELLMSTLKNLKNEVLQPDSDIKISLNGIETTEMYGFDVVNAEICTVFDALSRDNRGSDHVKLVSTWGKPCANPGSFLGALHAYLSSSSFREGTIKTIIGGGCNCSRANLCGALLGGKYLFDENDGIPRDWMLKSAKGIEVLEVALSKFGGRG